MLVAVFQWGDLGSLIGLSGTSPVEAFLPVMLFAILFGLSMDYQVFLVSRMHEEYIKSGGDNRVAVRNGLAATGKTITAAALIMILVFGSVHPGRQAGDQGVRHRAGRRHPGRCRLHPHGDRPVDHDSLRQGRTGGSRPGWTGSLPRLSVDADDLASSPEVDQTGTPSPSRSSPSTVHS